MVVKFVGCLILVWVLLVVVYRIVRGFCCVGLLVCLGFGFLWFNFCGLLHECGLCGFVCSAALLVLWIIGFGWFRFGFDVFLLFELVLWIMLWCDWLLVCVFWLCFVCCGLLVLCCLDLICKVLNVRAFVLRVDLLVVWRWVFGWCWF